MISIKIDGFADLGKLSKTIDQRNQFATIDPPKELNLNKYVDFKTTSETGSQEQSLITILLEFDV